MAPGGRAEGKENALNLSSDSNDRSQREPFLNDNFVVAGIPVRSGDADLTASGTPVRSVVQVQSFLRKIDFVDKTAGPMRGCAGQVAEADL